MILTINYLIFLSVLLVSVNLMALHLRNKVLLYIHTHEKVIIIHKNASGVEYILCVHGHVLIYALKHTVSSFSMIPNAKLCDIFKY